MIGVPTQPVASQTLQISLGGQSVQIALRQNGNAIYMDMSYNTIQVVNTRICRDRQRLLLDAQYHGFKGDFAFVDTQGESDPFYRGLGSRFVLYYIGVDE